MDKALPKKYKEGLTRVSEIVSFKFPFEGEAEERFVNWLEAKGVQLKDYMEEASSGGTYVHAALEKYALTGEFNGKKYKNIVNSGIQFFKDYDVKPIATEEYIRCKDYQGTIDLVAEINGEKWICDWKSYSLAKDKFGIPRGEYKKPYSKLKKAALQLNLYGRVKKIYKFAVIELTPDGYYFHELPRIEEKELKQIITEYKYAYVDQL